ncbi:MAG: hypothetical protein KDC05_01910 [Bacteroidales bacterium]|nr:hypothetical protein [Bacteroidales bacterium]
MENITSFQLVLIIIGFIALVTVLVVIFYKPAKELQVHCEFTPNQQKPDGHRLQLSVENTGKAKLKMMAPFIRFIHGPSSQIYQLKPEQAHCAFPKLLKVGDVVSCDFDLDDFRDKLKKNGFHPTHVKIEIKDTVGMKFSSHSIDYKI